MAFKVCEYATPTVPVGSGDVVVMVSVAGSMIMDSGLVALALALSVTWAVRLDVPAVVGVPVIAPVEELSVSPGGKEPLARDQE